MKRLMIACAVLLLAACAGGGTKTAAVARYDLGTAPRANGAQALALRGIDVSAPSWLGTPAMQYRLAYADVGRREIYAESRWAAPPAELLEVALRRRIVAGESDPGSAGCRLRIDLDEFVQVFDAPQSSRAVVEARIILQAPRGDQPLARHSLSLSKPASGADAKGGVAAFSALAGDLGSDVAAWLATLAKDNPALTGRCRGG